MVRIRALEVKKSREVAPAEGLTVAGAIEKAGVRVPTGGTVTVNGQVVADLNTPVADNSTVVVTPPVDNGGR